MYFSAAVAIECIVAFCRLFYLARRRTLNFIVDGTVTYIACNMVIAVTAEK